MRTRLFFDDTPTAVEVSERQWRDAAGVIAVQGDRLDAEYLTRAAERLGVGDLLERLMNETGGES